LIEAPRRAVWGFGAVVWLLAVVVSLSPVSAVAGTELAVTIDDLPATGPLPPGVTRLWIATQMIQALRQHAAPGVVGFANGGQVRDNPELQEILQAWRQAGFLGNHTLSHADLNNMSADEFVADIERNESLLAPLSPAGAAKYFRYPYLHEGNTPEKRNAVRRWLTSRDYAVAQVTVYFEDWAWNDVYPRCVAQKDEQAIARMKELFLEVAKARLAWSRELSARLFNRQVKHILMLHAGAFDALMLDELLRAYRADGVTLVGLESAVQDPAYATKLDLVGNGDRTFLLQVAEAKGVDVPPVASGPPPELDRMCR
jgi:peptidoglycan/xylan/chitin deacetylase (PgdA/CDA1 family)